MTASTDQLTIFEINELAHHEGIIERGLKTFVDVGQSLMFIRDRKLYRAKHKTFADYCRKRWDIGRSRGYQLIDAAKAFQNVHNCGQTDTPGAPRVMPETEGQIRPLSRLPGDEQAGAWQEAVEQSDGEQPTAADVERVVKARMGEAPGEDKPERTPLVQHMTGTDEWYTPQKYLDAARVALGGIITLDPASSATANDRVRAARFYTSEGNGLTKPWHAQTLWLNPPYSDTAKWVERWVKYTEGWWGFTAGAILLVFANTDTRWFQPLWRHWLCFTDHRIKFERPDGSTGDSPPKGSVFAYAGPCPEMFAQAFSQFGAIVPPAWDNKNQKSGGNIP